MPKPSFDFDKEYERLKQEQIAQLGDEPTEQGQDKSFLETIQDPEALKATVAGGLMGASFGLAPYIPVGGLGQKYDPEAIKSRFREIREANPGAYTTGEIAGNIITPIPGLGVATAPLKAAAIQGGVGAVQGLATSEEDGLSGKLGDALLGGATGAALGGVGQKVFQSVPKGVDKLKRLFNRADATDIEKTGQSIAENAPTDLISKAKRGVAQVLGSTPEDAKAIQANKIAIKAIEADKTPFSQKIVDMAKKVQADRNKFADAARATLADEPKFTANMVKQSLADIVESNRKINVDTNEMIPKNLDVDRALSDVIGEIDRVGTVSEKELKDLTLKYIDSRVTYEPKSSTDVEINNTLKEVRRRVDGLLKQNTEYDKAMKEVAPRQNLLDSVLPKYGLDEKSLGGIQETDKLTASLKKVGDERKIDTARDFINLGRLANDNPLQQLRGGSGLVREARLRALVDRNEAGVTNGSRNVNTFTALGRAVLPRLVTSFAGGTVGGLVGGDAGAATGALAGFAIDKQGRNIAKNLLLSGVPAKSIIENSVQPGVSKISQFAGTEFYDVLANAMKTGNYIATDFVLNTNPEYRKIKERNKDE